MKSHHLRKFYCWDRYAWSLHPETGLVQVSNTKVLENKPVKSDLEAALGYELKLLMMQIASLFQKQ